MWEDVLCLWQGHNEGYPLGRNLEDCCCRPEQEIVARPLIRFLRLSQLLAHVVVNALNSRELLLGVVGQIDFEFMVEVRRDIGNLFLAGAERVESSCGR